MRPLLFAMAIVCAACERSLSLDEKQLDLIAAWGLEQDRNKIHLLKERIDRGDHLSKKDAGTAWDVCSRHPAPDCAIVMPKAPVPLITSWEGDFHDQLRDAREQLDDRRPIDAWRATMFRVVCARNREDLKYACANVIPRLQ